MNTERAAPYPFYPRFAYASSPTYFAWVKITLQDIHDLREHPTARGIHCYSRFPRPANATGHGALFHLNHPIQFVSVVAPVIAIDEIRGRYVLLTVDDGSGATMVVKVRQVEQSVDTHSNTTVLNVNIFSTPISYWLEIDNERVDVGTVIRVKCTISSFRGERQLVLQRASVVKTTKDEAEAWLDTARCKLDTLSKPWQLTDQELETLEKEEHARVARAAEEARSKAEHKRARARLREKVERKMARKRREEHEAMDNGALV
jgi:Telomere regulation protein Stn1